MLRCLGSKFVLNTLLALAVLALPGNAYASFRVLYTFKGGSDGSGSVASLIADAAGNLYGTTASGGGTGCGGGGCGTVFRLAPNGTETVLYSFAGGEDGAYPVAGLIMGGSGNFYGTTSGGGTDGCEGEGCGTVFKLAPDGTETVLHAFAGGSDGSAPEAGLIMDSSGELYGTTVSGGSGANGTVFKLAPDGTETVLYAFQGGSDGGNPYAGLIMDKSGNLFGTTEYGGTGGIVSAGTVFEVMPDGHEKVLWDFCSRDSCGDGEFPVAGLIRDKAGNLYGTTTWGGIIGTAFKLAPDGTETVLHDFADRPDGANPYGGLVIDKSGNLYGTTFQGGKVCGDYGSSCGTVFKIAPDGTETVLHAFRKLKGDGIIPQSGLIKDARGNLYGTTPTLTWHSGDGTIFEITP